MEDKHSKLKGLITTIVVHTILIVCLFLYTLPAPSMEFPEPNGIEVALGDLVIGDDAVGEPAQDVQNTKETYEEATPSVADNYVTQNNEDAPVIKQNEKNKPNVETPKPELTPEEKLRIEKEEQRKQKQQALLNKNFNGNGGNNGANDKQGNGDTGANGGKVGDKNGSDNALNTKGTRGNPLGKGDINRFVKPLNTKNCNIRVTLLVKINSAGKVIEIYDVNTAESDQQCIRAAKEAALKTTFTIDDSRSVRYGKIQYDYSTSKN